MSKDTKDPEKAMEVVDSDHEDVEEDDDEVSAGDPNAAAKAALLSNPALLSALQGKLNGMVGSSSGYIQSLPAPVKRRLKALKKLQFEATKIEAKFYEEIHALEVKYHELYVPLYEKRAQINKGDYEPGDNECEWPSEDEDEDDEENDKEEELSEEMKEKAKIEKEEKEKNTKGVPEFWLTIFKNVDMLQDMVQPHDEPALQALTDVTATISEKPMGFTLYFHFAPNDYFTNTVLTKEYMMKCEPDEDDPFNFEGPEITNCKGCDVAWKAGKNLTVKTVKKKQKHKSKGSVRTVTKQVKNDSFFNFFAPPAIPENEDELDEETQELITSDFEIGHYIRERIIPRAVLFFTGEALEDDEDYDDEDDEEEEEGEEEEDDENDPDFDASKAKEKPECKQQ